MKINENWRRNSESSNWSALKIFLWKRTGKNRTPMNMTKFFPVLLNAFIITAIIIILFSTRSLIFSASFWGFSLFFFPLIFLFSYYLKFIHLIKTMQKCNIQQKKRHEKPAKKIFFFINNEGRKKWIKIQNEQRQPDICVVPLNSSDTNAKFCEQWFVFCWYTELHSA